MYLIDTNVISEYRKKNKANKGVRSFFRQVIEQRARVFLSVVTVGELRRGVELIRHCGDIKQAKLLETWLSSILDGFQDYILDIDKDTAQVWGKLRVPHHENALDKQIAATALIHDLTLVTRNETHFNGTGVKIINPFED
jgi:predicted nucleic acid-binding protein